MRVCMHVAKRSDLRNFLITILMYYVLLPLRGTRRVKTSILSILPFWDFHSIKARIITHMRKLISNARGIMNTYVRMTNTMCDVYLYN